ncbi:MAG: NTP transferase domain-containing protein [Halorubrum sp.]
MCGGRGTRLGGDTEKPLVPIRGRPMVDRVHDALAESRIETVYPVVSPHARATRAHLTARCRTRDPASGRDEVRVVDAPGDGYVADLQYALDTLGLGETRVLTVAADLPLLDDEAVDGVVAAARRVAPDSLTVCVPAARKRALGVSADTATVIDGESVVPAGINVVSGATHADDVVHVTDDRRLAVNVNYPSDLQVAEALLTATADPMGGVTR